MTCYQEALEQEDAKRWREHAALIKVAERAALTSEYLRGVTLGAGGSKILQLLEEALNELDEIVK